MVGGESDHLVGYCDVSFDVVYSLKSYQRRVDNRNRILEVEPRHFRESNRNSLVSDQELVRSIADSLVAQMLNRPGTNQVLVLVKAIVVPLELCRNGAIACYHILLGLLPSLNIPEYGAVTLSRLLDPLGAQRLCHF